MLIGTTQALSKIGNLLAVRVNGQLIRRVYKSKYLGLIADDKLSWKDHIDLISFKIRRNIGVMKRVREYVPGEILILLHRTLVEPYLRYCNTTWGYCGATLLNRLQALQNRAVRVIKGLQYDEADHPKILRELGILNVEQLVRLDTASLVYRIENNLAPEQLSDFFTKCSDTHAYNTRAASSGNYVIAKMRTEKRKQAFQNTGAKVWNELPDHIRRAPSIEIFKEKMRKMILED